MNLRNTLKCFGRDIIQCLGSIEGEKDGWMLYPEIDEKE